MNDYYYQYDFPILNQHQKADLLELSKSEDHNFRSYVNPNGKADGNQVWRDESLYVKDYVKLLVENCNLNCFPLLVRQQAGMTVIKHKDDRLKRNTVLSIPIEPAENYPWTYFYDSYETKRPVAAARFINMNPCLMNTQEIHALINTSNGVRLNFQLCFDNLFQDVRDRLINRQLFKIDLESVFNME